MRRGMSSSRFSLRKDGVVIVMTGFFILTTHSVVVVVAEMGFREMVVVVVLFTTFVALFEETESSGWPALALIHLQRKLWRERRIILLQLFKAGLFCKVCIFVV